MNTSLDNLKSKFYPDLLGHPKCQAAYKDEVDTLFKEPDLFEPLDNKNFILDGGKWILKTVRNDLMTYPDTHLYRIRKAKKIRAYIRNNHLEQQIAVPQKHLYWHEEKKQFYVVSEKLPLSNEVGTIIPAFEIQLTLAGALGQKITGQAKAFYEKAPRRELNSVQAKALAELSILGYTDLTYNNLFFTEDGKIAILDTEPHKRALKKAVFKHTALVPIGQKETCLALQAICGMAYLKLYCTNQEALRVVEKVESRHAIWTISKLVAKAALICLSIYCLPAAAACLPTHILALKITSYAIAFFKFYLICNTIHFAFCIRSVCYVWKISNQTTEGINKLANLQKRGVF